MSQAGPHPKALIQVWMGSQWEGLPETDLGEGGIGWTLLHSRQIGAIRICECLSHFFNFASLIIILRLKRDIMDIGKGTSLFSMTDIRD